MLNDIHIFLEQAHNLSSLIIESSLNKYRISESFKNIYSIIPRQLKHIQVPINNLDQIKMILERCDTLSTITFPIKSKFSIEVIKWFNTNTINSTCKNFKRTVTVWIGKKNIQSNDDQTDNNNKRIKLNDDSSHCEMV